MPTNVRFWRNLTLIGLAHAALITGLVRWSRETKTTPQSIVWMNGGAGDGAGAAKATPPPKPKKISTPAPEPKAETKDEPDEDHPVLTSARSEIQLPTPTASPRSTSTPKPSPTPKVKVTPKPSPKKLIMAKASPKPKSTPDEAKKEDAKKQEAEFEKKIQLAKDVLEKKEPDASEKPPKAIPVNPTGSGKGTSSGSGGRIGGTGGQSRFGWYGSMLHDRFYSEWVQPTSLATGDKLSALVKIRIEKDGRVSSFDIVRPSGNASVDESVNAVAKRVTEVDPLPAGLGNGEHYDVKINFELNSDQ